MNNETSHSNAGALMFSFLLGGIVGAGLAFLLAPQSGAETRRKIREATDDIRHKADDLVNQTKESVDSAIGRGKDIIAEEKTVLGQAIKAGKEAFHKAKEREITEG